MTGWKRSTPIVLLFATLVSLVGFASAQEVDQLQQTAQALFAPLPEVAANPNNPVTEAKVDLGKMLYYEPRLSLSGVFSCNSCHNIATYGVDNLETSTGHGWRRARATRRPS